MKEIQAVKINTADFAPYGSFYSMTEPEGYPLQGEIINFTQTAFQEPVSAAWDFLRSR